ncbi:hypothetical protein ACXQBP_12845, partial [Staphylococcus argenteus]
MFGIDSPVFCIHMHIPHFLVITVLNICAAKKIGSAINIAFKNDMINPKIILTLYGLIQFKILNV